MAGRNLVAGTFRTFRFDVTRYLRPGRNVLAVEVLPVSFLRDLTLTWIDWNPKPPDRGMGLWQDVYLTTSGPVTIDSPQVLTTLSLPGLERAGIEVRASVSNAGAAAVKTLLEGTIGSLRFARTVSLGPGQTRVVTFDPATDPQLEVSHPRVWWPAGMGGQPLYRLTLRAVVAGTESDRAETSFGIRSVQTDFLQNGARRWLVNGRPILIRGAGWAPDIFLREEPARTEAELRYVLDMGLNAVRLEGKLGSNRFYDLTDRMGILVLPGWMCCDRWQFNRHWSGRDLRIATASMDSQARLLRNHPSVAAFLIGSDQAPRPQIERAYLNVLHRERWPDPILASASDDRSPALGPTGVKMTGPYDWIPPNYWYSPKAPGGGWGFNTETGPGASIPTLAELAADALPERTAGALAEATRGPVPRGRSQQSVRELPGVRPGHGRAPGAAAITC